MVWHRYSKWDGSQEPFPFRADEVLSAISQHLMEYGDLSAALKELIRRGLASADGRRIVGLEELRRRLRERRRALLQRHNLGHLFDKLNAELDEILNLERTTLQQQQGDAASILGRQATNLLRRMLARDEPLPPGTFESMWYSATQRLRELDVLPETFHGRLAQLREYEWANDEARDAYMAMVDNLKQKLLGHYFRDVREQLQGMSAEDQARMARMLTDLAELIVRHANGEDIDEDFRAFKRNYPQLFVSNPDMTFEELLQQLVEQMAMLLSLMHSLSPEEMEALQGLLDGSFLGDELQQAMQELSELLEQLVPPDMLEALEFQGGDPLGFDEALQTLEQLHQIDRLDDKLERAFWRGTFDDIESAHVEEAMGPEGRRMLEDLRTLAKTLEDARYVRRSGKGVRLTSRALRRMGTNALHEIFARVEDKVVGKHQSRSTRNAGIPTDASRPYQYGDPLHLNVTRTIFNALKRSDGQFPIEIDGTDFEISELEYQARCATVVLIDQSSSMGRLGRFAAAKRVALALQELIRQRFPRDELFLVGFHTLSQEVTFEELPTLREKPRQDAIYIDEVIPLDLVHEFPQGVPMDFTNVQEGLRVARRLLERTSAKTKQIIMITDGQPTAYIAQNHLCLSFPDVARPIAAALREVRRCTRRNIRINTFMLREHDFFLEQFVEQITEINRGRAFFTSPANLGSVVMRDYVRGRTSRV